MSGSCTHGMGKVVPFLVFKSVLQKTRSKQEEAIQQFVVPINSGAKSGTSYYHHSFCCALKNLIHNDWRVYIGLETTECDVYFESITAIIITACVRPSTRKICNHPFFNCHTRPHSESLMVVKILIGITNCVYNYCRDMHCYITFKQ